MYDSKLAGRVTSVSIKRSGLNGGDLFNDCVRKIISDMEFPQSKKGLATNANIGFPFGLN